MWKAVGLLLLLVGGHAPAAAASVYLDCSLPPQQWKLGMNEQGGTVDWSVPGTGRSGRVPAQFRPELVTFQVLSATFEVSRVNLSIVQSVPDGINKAGKCNIATAAKRSF
jgi:hypothetical protein